MELGAGILMGQGVGKIKDDGGLRIGPLANPNAVAAISTLADGRVAPIRTNDKFGGKLFSRFKRNFYTFTLLSRIGDFSLNVQKVLIGFKSAPKRCAKVGV